MAWRTGQYWLQIVTLRRRLPLARPLAMSIDLGQLVQSSGEQG